jgi:hypothetical protein
MVLVGIKGTAEEGIAEEGTTGGAAEDTIEDSVIENIAELIGGYPAIVIRVLIVKVTWDGVIIVGMTGADILVNEARILRFEVYINNITGFGAVLIAGVPPTAPQIEVNGLSAEIISMSEPGLG